MNRLFPAILLTGTAIFLSIPGDWDGGISDALESRLAQVNAGAASKLIYADFDQPLDAGARPVSARGGLVELTGYQQDPSRRSRYKGAAQSAPAAPELVRLQKDSPNRAAAFDYELLAPNLFAGVWIEIHGQADRDGKTVTDDVSGYRFLSLQVYLTGTRSLRLEFISQGQGIYIPLGSPQMTFSVQPGFNTYRLPLKSLAQPFWAGVKVNPKDVLRKLTSIKLIVYCDNCESPVKGTVVIDNISFEN